MTKLVRRVWCDSALTNTNVLSKQTIREASRRSCCVSGHYRVNNYRLHWCLKISTMSNGDTGGVYDCSALYCPDTSQERPLTSRIVCFESSNPKSCWVGWLKPFHSFTTCYQCYYVIWREQKPFIPATKETYLF